ncbi:MAG: phytanoyl-CoA dioxygenase family protein [Thermoleophilia bacterium]|nr:phytanoyl-CoA dioxygenase family protein [Thermoleophilia bacterium]MDH4339969.1 phytanoyl-CoA dioxygenase family protein [Thermoleophilia bacterium]MDH5280561.1 phytanoyl-CoA dioxygenase family protein [Thermoleophilia bacterium]
MHRTKTRFAARVNHVATALERRGVRATYRLHDRVLSNRRSRRLFRGDRPELDDLQGRILQELETEGYSVLAFTELFPDVGLREDIEEQSGRFVAETKAGLAGDRGGLRVRAGKEFVVRLHSYGVELSLEDPWFRACTSRRMLDIANTYLDLWSKLEYTDMWYSVPQAEEAERVASQRWHRDFNDRRLVKAFLYLADVDESMGPFEYVPGSAGKGPYASVWPWKPLGDNYPSQEEFAERVPEASIKTFTAPKGTLIFCDTAGFHRGGLSTTHPRVLATVTYSSPASLVSLTERSYHFTGALASLDSPTRFAVT